MVTLESLNFDNAAIRELPVDPNPNQDVRANVPGCCYSLVKPQPVEGPQLVCASKDAFALLGLDLDQMDEEELAKYFSGNRVLAGSQTYAHCYCGYQFGFFSGQLGDGAATSLGEVVNAEGQRWELQLKGAGKTPYSRQGDGRKVLRSSLREFLCSEAMHHLGIPTTRAGCVVTSSTRVERDMFYTGNVKMEHASIVLRLAPTFMRFGSFEIFKMREESNTDRGGPSSAHPALLPRMLDFLIFYHFRGLWEAAGGGDTLEAAPSDKKDMYISMFEQVVTRTAETVAAWQCVGFCHGVLNTDNMSMLGLTLDYGPFGFLDRYNDHHISNTSDDQGRYSFSAQPQMCEWNCRMLGEALRLVLPRAEAKQVVAKFWPAYSQAFHARMRAKLGLVRACDGLRTEAGSVGEGLVEDEKLIVELLEVMQSTGVDFTNTFRALRRIPMPDAAPVDTVDMTTDGSNGSPPVEDGGFLEAVLADCCSPAEAVEMVGSRLKPQQLKMLAQFALREPALLVAMGINPQEVQREQEKADMARALADTTPEAKAANDRSAWTRWVHKYAKRLYLERQAGTTPEERVQKMDQSNPRIVLRNWIAQAAIERAEDGDYSLAKRVLKLLERPFEDYSDSDLAIQVKVAACGVSQETEPWRLDLPPPPVYRAVRVSCSS